MRIPRSFASWHSSTGIMRTWIFWLFLIGMAFGLLNALVIVTTALATGGKIDFAHPFLWEMTGSFSFVILIPLMIFLFDRLPLRRGNLAWRIPIYLLTILACGVIHTSVMYLSRISLYSLLGWGGYNYGYLPFRYIMETLKLFISFWVIWAIFALYTANKERQRDKLRAAQLEEELIKTRLEFLKSRINPHFLFNTLNMISSTMYESVEDADKMMANLSGLLRKSLKSSGRTHSLKEECDALDLYLEIMKARFQDRLTICSSIDKTALGCHVPAFLLQPLVENSIKHGMDSLQTVEIHLSVERTDRQLLISVADNGPGIHLALEESLSHGIGLSDTRERLEKLYTDDFEFCFENVQDGGLAVNIKLPILDESAANEGSGSADCR